MPRKKLESSELSGVAVDAPPQSQTSTPAATPPTSSQANTGNLNVSAASVTLDGVPPLEFPVIEALRQKAKEEAENGSGAPKGPHPYEYQIVDKVAVPEAFRASDYAICRDKIEANLQDAWDHGRNPVIPGVMIGVRV